VVRHHRGRFKPSHAALGIERVTSTDRPQGLLSQLFARTAREGRAALIGYVPAGFPTMDGAIGAMRAMVDGGVDALEVGLPYSDPLLDGPTIQAAVDQALHQGVTTADVMETVRQVAATGAPTVVMSYWNPIERYGVERFATELAGAGGAGVVTSDITPDEAGEWLKASSATGLDRIFLVAPSSTSARIELTTSVASGFVYAAAVMGVTGARDRVGPAAEALVRRVKEVTALPVCVGLGVSTGEQAAEIARFADGVIVGSAFVRALQDADTPAAGVDNVRALAAELRAGVERASVDRVGRPG
jgi:tryptophan synthase alpha chain